MQTNSQPEWQVILNPHAGCGKGLHDMNEIIRILNESEISYQLNISEYPGHTIQLAKQLANLGNIHFILAGGDGTLNEAVNGIFNRENNFNEKIIIGMIPVGTGNDWTKTFGIPDNYRAAMDIIKVGKTVIQDVGELEHFDNETSVKRFFVNIAGFGFDALVAGHANTLKNKGISGLRVYIQSFLWSYKHFKVRPTIINIDGKELNVNLFSISVGIGKYNGGGMMQVPEANPVKGEFHITIIRKIGILGIIKNFKGLYNGSFTRDRRVSTHKGKVVEIIPKSSIAGEADGESLGSGTYKIKILPHKLHVICSTDANFN
jgi:YegS/Rv2252/BmrU family lipid kinase